MALRTIYPQRHFLTVDGTINGIVGIADVTQLVVGATGMIYDVNNDPLPISVAYVDTVNSKLTLNSNGTTLDARPFTASGGAVVDFPFQMVDGPEAIPPWYTIPIASPTVLGGIKVGANLSIDVGGVLSANGVVAPYTLQGIGDTVPLTINAISGQTSKLQSWQVNGSEKAYFDKDGGGYFASTSQFISSGAGTFPIKIYKYASTFPHFAQYSAGGTPEAPTQTLSGDNIGGFNMFGYGTAGWAGGPSVRIRALASENNQGTSNRGASLLFEVVRTGGTSLLERFRIDGTDGFIGINHSTPAAQLHVRSGTVDGATAVAAIVDTSTNWVISGSKLLSIRNNGVEKAYIDKDGLLSASILVASANVNTPLVRGTGLIIRTDTADGGTAPGVVTNTNSTYVTTGAKILTVQNGGATKAYVDKDGGLWLNDQVRLGGLTPNGSGTTAMDNVAGARFYQFNTSGTVANLIQSDGASYFTGGNIGIGFTGAPLYPFTIAKAGTVLSSTIYLNFGTVKDTTSYQGVALGYDNATQTGVVVANSAGAASNLAFYTYTGSAWGERARISGGGNFGIGTNNPGYKLHVVDGGTQFRFSSAGQSNFEIYGSNASIVLNTPTGNPYPAFTWKYNDATAMIWGMDNNTNVFTSHIYPSNTASTIAYLWNTGYPLSIAGAKLVSFQNNAVEKAYIDKDGYGLFAGGLYSGNPTTAGSLTVGNATGTTAVRLDTNSGHGQFRMFDSGNVNSVKFLASGDCFFNTGGGLAIGVSTLTSGFSLDVNGNILARSELRVGGTSGTILWAQSNGLYVSTIVARNDTEALTLRPRASDGGTAVCFIVDNANTLSTTGAKLASFRNNGVERAYISKDGWFQGPSYVAIRGTSDYAAVQGLPTDSATAVAVYLDSISSLGTVGAKLVSIRNGGTEKAYFDKDGFLVIAGANTSGSIQASYFYGANSGITPFLGRTALDAAGLVGASIGSLQAWTTAGTKLVSFVNGGVEKASIDKDGYITSAGSPVSRKVAVPATAASAGTPGDWAADASWLYICTAANTWQRTAITLATW